MGQMHIAPRFKQAFGIVSIDPLAGVCQFLELIEESFSLVETHLGELNTAQTRERFRERR